MTTLVTKADPAATTIEVTDEFLTVTLNDGLRVSNPLAWYPRLRHGTSAERSRNEILGDGEAIHWPDLDEDLSVESIVAGRRSGERPQSIERWLASRAQRLP